MSLINKIEEEFAALRFFLMSALGEHFHIHSGVDDALDGVKAIVREHIPGADENTTAEPAAPSEASGETAEPSASLVSGG